MTDKLLQKLNRRSSQTDDDELSELLEQAISELERKEQSLNSLQRELDETNEGMVALTMELQQAERRYRALFEDAGEGIYKTSSKLTEYRLVNDSFADILGYENAATIEETVSIADVFAEHERYETYREQLSEQGELTGFEYQIVRPDGERRWVTDTVRSVKSDDGTTVYRGGILDITERKEYERKLKERNQALETLNQFVRHDIRNDVQVVSLYAEQLEQQVADENATAVKRIKETATNIEEITQDAAAFVETLTSGEEIDLEPVSLQSVISAELESRRSAHPDATFTVAGSLPFVEIRADGMFDSVLRNILNNAVVHNDADTPVIEVDTTVKNDDVIVRIRDNGPGIPDDLKNQIFGKGNQGLDSDGTGMGLYLVSQLVSSYGGKVTVKDRNEPFVDAPETTNNVRGTAFVLRLPRSE